MKRICAVVLASPEYIVRRRNLMKFKSVGSRDNNQSLPTSSSDRGAAFFFDTYCYKSSRRHDNRPRRLFQCFSQPKSCKLMVR